MYCDLPSVGTSLNKGLTLCTLESVKAVGEVYSPVEGEVVEVNDKLAGQPNLVNQEPEGSGWLVKLKHSGAFADVSKALKDAQAYKATLEDQ